MAHHVAVRVMKSRDRLARNILVRRRELGISQEELGRTRRCQQTTYEPDRKLGVFNLARYRRQTCRSARYRPRQATVSPYQLASIQTRVSLAISPAWTALRQTNDASLVVHVLNRFALPSRNHLTRVPFIQPSDKLSAVFVEDPFYRARLRALFAHIETGRILGSSFLIGTHYDRRGGNQIEPHGCRHSSTPQLTPSYSLIDLSTGDFRHINTSRSGCSYKCCRCTIKNAKGRKNTQNALVVL